MMSTKKPKPRYNDHKPKKTPKSKTLSRLHKAKDMGLEKWQTALRWQFSHEQKFKLKNIGSSPVFSEFHVPNSQSGSIYRVAIRGTHVGDNHCACPDFATYTLGSCKHIQFALARLEHKRGGKAVLRAGFKQPYSEVALRYGGRREVRFLAGTQCPSWLLAEAKKILRYDWNPTARHVGHD